MKKFTITALLLACFVLIGQGQIYLGTDTLLIQKLLFYPLLMLP